VWAARKTGRPVKWVGERIESIMSDTHGRDCVSEASLALDTHGKFLGLRVTTDHNQGAYLSASAGVPAGLGSMAYTNVYDIPTAHVTLRACYTHSTPTGPYRGAGKPEAIYVMERLVDMAAAELKIDAIELRRRNLIKPAQVPYQTQLVLAHDSANYEAVMDAAVARALPSAERNPNSAASFVAVASPTLWKSAGRSATAWSSASTKAARSRSWPAPTATVRAMRQSTPRWSRNGSASTSLPYA
jgi:CO/xanthine dehydrogenase Mo-binding subunit